MLSPTLLTNRFSSNVVEKCIRVADPEVRKNLVGEVLNRSRLEKLLRDSYGNYVIQTILDYCDPAQRMIVSESRQTKRTKTLTYSLSSVFDLFCLLSETRHTGNEFSPSSLVKTRHSVTVVGTKGVDEVVDEVDSEKIEEEVVDTIDTLDDLSSSTSMLLPRYTDLKEDQTWADHHNTVCPKDTILILPKVMDTDTEDMADTAVMDTWLLPILECRTMPQDLMDNHGSTSEDLVVNPLPTGPFMKVPTLVNYHPVTKVHPLHPFTVTT
jgi:hypothetical protein